MCASIQPYETLRRLTHDLYTLDGDWYDTPFRRRMTVIRLNSGQLVIHSPIRLKTADFAQLDQLGTVHTILAPNCFHGSEAHDYKLRYPKAKLLVADPKQLPKGCVADGVLPEAWGAEHRAELDCMVFTGTRLLKETVFFHRASQTLIVTDLVFNMQKEVAGGTKAFFKLNRIYKRFGPSRVMRHIFVNDCTQASQSFGRIMKWDFDRVIMSHGEILETGGRESMLRGFEEMGLSPRVF